MAGRAVAVGRGGRAEGGVGGQVSFWGDNEGSWGGGGILVRGAHDYVGEGRTGVARVFISPPASNEFSAAPCLYAFLVSCAFASAIVVEDVSFSTLQVRSYLLPLRRRTLRWSPR